MIATRKRKNTKDPQIKTREVRAKIDVKKIEDLKLENFVTPDSYQFFQILGFENVSFLQEDVQKWTTNKNYIKLQERISNLRVVNDIAERGVALVTEYNNLLTKNEKQQQALFLTVSKHRKMLLDMQKNTIIKFFLFCTMFCSYC